jgi:hypothetical protein
VCFHQFLFQCLFEAQSAKYLFSTLKTTSTTALIDVECNSIALDAYAVGYFIANFPIGVSWDVTIHGGGHHSFTGGLNTNVPSAGVINRLQWTSGILAVDISDLKPHHLIGTTALGFNQFRLTNTGMIHLSELIPHLTSLKELTIACQSGQEDGLLKVLQQLCHSNVTSLDIGDTKVVHDYVSALRCLMHPSSGKLEHLRVDGDQLVDLLSAPSSLKSLFLVTQCVPSHAVYLKNNTNLTRLELHSGCIVEDEVPALIDIVKYNWTLKVLVLRSFTVGDKGCIDHLRPLVSALHDNNTLLTIEIHVDLGVFRYLKETCEELTLDSRITWNYSLVLLSK